MSIDQQIIKQKWDVVVVGTGIGGATLGFALAKAGKKVLFCEQGYAHSLSGNALTGDYAERFLSKSSAEADPKQRDVFLKSGRFSAKIKDNSNRRSRSYIPFIGSGTGGSSALYGMAMERFFPDDFSSKKQYFNQASGISNMEWPITYNDLEPYYCAAEELYRVKGGVDALKRSLSSSKLPLSPSIQPANQELFDYLKQQGMHPYHLPLACDFVDDCKGCQGFLCDKQCKNDSAKICLLPAIEQYGAALLSECKVSKLLYKNEKVTDVVCQIGGEEFNIKGDLVVLAAGALETPCILLNSKSEQCPDGLANESGLVGKNLMRHFIDLYVFATKAEVSELNSKEIAFNDFYVHNGIKFGSVQSFGFLPPPPVLVESMHDELLSKGQQLLSGVVKCFKPLLQFLFYWLFSNKIILVSILEDLPYQDNQVRLSDQNHELEVEYNLKSTDRNRINQARVLMKNLLKPYRPMLLKQAENSDRIAHASGTCRFGTDPGSSVLNASNRAHSVLNLYVVDSSFFPSSAGTNPSLTIAANALRVADSILKED